VDYPPPCLERFIFSFFSSSIDPQTISSPLYILFSSNFDVQRIMLSSDIFAFVRGYENYYSLYRCGASISNFFFKSEDFALWWWNVMLRLLRGHLHNIFGKQTAVYFGTRKSFERTKHQNCRHPTQNRFFLMINRTEDKLSG